MRYLYIFLAMLIVPAAFASTVVDLETQKPVPFAKITIPQKNYETYTDENGTFNLDATVEGQSIISVEKEGYRPYSLTVDSDSASKPIIMGVEKSELQDIVLDTDVIHIGDDNYAQTSANSGEFRVKSVGPFYTKTFKMSADSLKRENYLVLGSVIGLDTKLAREMGQNKIVNSYASPTEIFFNGNKISELHLNGDGQRIRLPNNLIRPDNMNEITIKTGKNLMQTAYIDYDDIEIMNLSIQSGKTSIGYSD